MKRSIIELMTIPPKSHDLEWLKDSLQSAIELELATLSPYLCALWSIKNSSGDAYTLIRSIVLEEMLHMGLVCNMLTAIGGTPILNNISDLPTFPGHLPGGVRPDLNIYLAGLSKDYLEKVCMQIEYPENGPVVSSLKPTTITDTYPTPTIGSFYDGILTAFQQLNPPLSLKNQLNGATLNGYPLYPVTTLADVQKAINEIKEQGEGTSHSPDVVDFGGELAHYHKFAEIFYGNHLVKQDDSWSYTGAPIAFPDVYPMAAVPIGGYINPPESVKADLQSFNQIYLSMLNGLQQSWSNGSEVNLSEAIGKMFSLKELAVKLMQVSLPDGNGVYGPDFLLKTS